MKVERWYQCDVCFRLVHKEHRKGTRMPHERRGSHFGHQPVGNLIKVPFDPEVRDTLVLPKEDSDVHSH